MLLGEAGFGEVLPLPPLDFPEGAEVVGLALGLDVRGCEDICG